jgi:dipeptidyl aminopeptidase/acylaminoacyl peptidase
MSGFILLGLVAPFLLPSDGRTDESKTGKDTPPPASAFAPQVEVQKEDYVEARSRFRTKLLRKGPAPQKWEEPKSSEDAEQVEFRSGDLRLKAWVSRPSPSADGKQPAVLFLHGGFAFDRGDWIMSKPYRDAGFVVLTPILRGENGQGGAFTLFYEELEDVLAAAAYLRGLPHVDKEHIFVAGHSSGGTLAMLAAMNSRDFRASSSFSGSPDQVLASRLQPEAADRGLPFDRSDPREFQLRSPLSYAASFKCPTRIYFGTKEPWWEQVSRQTAAIAKKKGLDVQAVQVEGDHSSSIEPAMKQSIAFFKTHL